MALYTVELELFPNLGCGQFVDRKFVQILAYISNIKTSVR